MEILDPRMVVHYETKAKYKTPVQYLAQFITVPAHRVQQGGAYRTFTRGVKALGTVKATVPNAAALKPGATSDETYEYGTVVISGRKFIVIRRMDRWGYYKTERGSWAFFEDVTGKEEAAPAK